MIFAFFRNLFTCRKVTHSPSEPKTPSNDTTPSMKPSAQFQLSTKSLERLKGVHPDLVRVVKRAIEVTPVDFVVLEGLRTKARQQQLVAQGASRTMHSRHLTGHAVDLAPYVDGKVSWHWPHFYPLAEAVKQAAAEEGVAVEWGGDWESFKDGPHWQLPRSTYPA